MASETWIERGPELSSSYLQKFRLYETRSNFYMIGRDKSRTVWRVLKIDRTEPVELYIHEDPTNYSETECFELLRRIHEGNRSTGGLKFVTACYGIVGFVRFLGPYYMLIITKRKKLGAICGQTIYSIAKSEMVIIPNASVQSSVAYSKDEKRSFVDSSCKRNMFWYPYEIHSNYTFHRVLKIRGCYGVSFSIQHRHHLNLFITIIRVSEFSLVEFNTAGIISIPFLSIRPSLVQY